MQSAVPCRDHQTLSGQYEGSGEMERVEASQVVCQCEVERVFDKLPIDLDHAERLPLRLHRPDRRGTCSESDGTSRFEEANSAGKPGLGAGHHFADLAAARLRHVSLDQRARVEIEVQRSASRSARTHADALADDFFSRGAREGAAVAGVSRP